jgi:hypothetical protein
MLQNRLLIHYVIVQPGKALVLCFKLVLSGVACSLCLGLDFALKL